MNKKNKDRTLKLNEDISAVGTIKNQPTKNGSK